MLFRSGFVIHGAIHRVKKNTNDADRLQNGYQRTGDLITLPYIPLKAIEQPFASRIENVQPYVVPNWLGPDEFLIQCTEDKTSNIINELRDILSDNFYSLTDVSDYYLTIRLSGQKSIEVLSKGCPLNFKK